MLMKPEREATVPTFFLATLLFALEGDITKPIQRSALCTLQYISYSEIWRSHARSKGHSSPLSGLSKVLNVVESVDMKCSSLTVNR